MVFGFATVTLVVGTLWLTRQLTLKHVLLLAAVEVAAVIAVLPLAREYMRFSRESSATFSPKLQLHYSSHVQDYVLPYNGTLMGKLYYHANPSSVVNAFNLDSYSYHGITLYVISMSVVVAAFVLRKRSAEMRHRFSLTLALGVVGLVGFLASLGPLLQIKGSYVYGEVDGKSVVIPAPYALVDKLLPQLGFLRGVGRWSVLLLIALCCLLAIGWRYFSDFVKKPRTRRIVAAAAIGLLVFELAPMHVYRVNQAPYANQFAVPAVYKYIKAHEEIDYIVVIIGDSDYPGAIAPTAQAEWALWAGYDNRYTFNGYSGYQPPDFMPTLIDFKDLDAQDVSTMKRLGLKYVLIDKQLSVTNPALVESARNLFAGNLVYHDERFDLYKI
jgi:hypothetical protein